MSEEKGGRVASIDVFRGLTIFVMVFVNELARHEGIPAWMKHAPSEQDWMSFVDVVFPAFLFIVGMSIPLALGKRMERGASAADLWSHILLRTGALLILGVFMVNMHGFREDAMPLSGHWWTFLVFVAVMFAWNVYPKTLDSKLANGLKIFGAIVLIVLAILYRGDEDGSVRWMRTYWWGILGLIGWAYLTASATYLAFRNRLPALLGAQALLTLLFIGDQQGALDFFGVVRDYVWLGGQIGAHSSMVVAGVVVSTLFLKDAPTKTPKERIVWTLAYAAFLFVAGYLLADAFGISKTRATPAWALYSLSICAALFAFFYWLVDLRGKEGWFAFLRPAGVNPLLAYILPYTLYALFGALGAAAWLDQFHQGVPAILWSIVFSFAILGATAALTKWGVRLKL